MEWYTAAFLSSLLLAVRSDVNRWYKLDGLRLNFFTNLFLAALMVPFIMDAYWPEVGSLFYVIAFIVSILVTVVMTVKNNLSANFNGRVSNMEMPIKTFVLYFFWWLLDPEALQRSIDNPVETAGVILMLILASYALNHTRKGDVGWHIFVQIVPIALISSVGDALTKYALEDYQGNIMDAMYLFIALTAFGSMVISGVTIYARPSFAKPREGKIPKLLAPNMIRASVITSVVAFFMLITLFYALYAAPNPAYVTALNMLTPIWLLVFHKLRGIPDDASPYMGALMVVSAIGLILITS